MGTAELEVAIITIIENYMKIPSERYWRNQNHKLFFQENCTILAVIHVQDYMHKYIYIIQFCFSITHISPQC